MPEPKLIIGYFGIGKSTLQELRPELDIFDLHHVPTLAYLTDNLDHDYIVADPDWLKVFGRYVRENNRRFYLILPSLDRKDEFLYNIANRTEGMHNEWFINRRDREWEKEITALATTKNADVRILRSGYLADIIDQL